MSLKQFAFFPGASQSRQRTVYSLLGLAFPSFVRSCTPVLLCNACTSSLPFQKRFTSPLFSANEPPVLLLMVTMRALPALFLWSPTGDERRRSPMYSALIPLT